MITVFSKIDVSFGTVLDSVNDMEILLRCFDRRMPHGFFDLQQLRAGSQRLQGKEVTEGMRAQFRILDICLFQIFFHDHPQGSC